MQFPIAITRPTLMTVVIRANDSQDDASETGAYGIGLCRC